MRVNWRSALLPDLFARHRMVLMKKSGPQIHAAGGCHDHAETIVSRWRRSVDCSCRVRGTARRIREHSGQVHPAVASARHLQFLFFARKLGYWEKRGLTVSIDRGFGSTKVCVPVDQGQYDFGLIDLAVMAGCAGRGWISSPSRVSGRARRSAFSRSRKPTSPSRRTSRVSRWASTSAAANSSSGRPS